MHKNPSVEEIADAVWWHGPDIDAYNGPGHSGNGVYLSSSEYPEDGATFLGNPTADELLKVIVELGRRAAAL